MHLRLRLQPRLRLYALPGLCLFLLTFFPPASPSTNNPTTSTSTTTTTTTTSYLPLLQYHHFLSSFLLILLLFYLFFFLFFLSCTCALTLAFGYPLLFTTPHHPSRHRSPPLSTSSRRPYKINTPIVLATSFARFSRYRNIGYFVAAAASHFCVMY